MCMVCQKGEEVTEEEYNKELDRLNRKRTSVETEAYRMENLYRNALREVDSVKEQIRQLKQAWVNQQQGDEDEIN